MRAPDPERLKESADNHSSCPVSDKDSDNALPRAKRNSKKAHNGDTSDPTQLQFYPSQWKDVLDETKDAFALIVFTKLGFLERSKDLSTAGTCLVNMLAKHEAAGNFVEDGNTLTVSEAIMLTVSLHTGFYPDYVNEMTTLVCSQLSFPV